MCYVFDGKTDDIIAFTQFEDGNILTKTRNDVESNDDESIMSPLLSEEYIYAVDSGNESYHDHISTEILEDICDGSQSRLNANQREAKKIKYVIVLGK